MRSILNKYKLVFMIVLVFVLIVIATSIASTKVSALEPVDLKIADIRTDYSQYLETGETTRKTNYSPKMRRLVNERRAYYSEFFEKALYTNLVSIGSEFGIENANILSRNGNLYTVSVGEKVTLHGNQIVTSPDDYHS